jgi:hypothetical protein
MSPLKLFANVKQLVVEAREGNVTASCLIAPEALNQKASLTESTQQAKAGIHLTHRRDNCMKM